MLSLSQQCIRPVPIMQNKPGQGTGVQAGPATGAGFR